MDDYKEKDIEYLRRVVEQHGDYISKEDAYKLWYYISDLFGANWLAMPENNQLFIEPLKKYYDELFPEKDELFIAF